MSTNPAEAYALKMQHEREENTVQIDHLDEIALEEGAYHSKNAYSCYAPSHVRKPIGFGEFKGTPDTWFYLSEFHAMMDELPDIRKFVDIVTKVHCARIGKSPAGKFGSVIPTHLANITNDSRWQAGQEK
ncbi:hypothetical protein N0V90_011581 [Kalmusia sp. IMI 367209]|nr:hypothetical protein N0V90_011581 [Kalmusia sp. IMI 367209]